MTQRPKPPRARDLADITDPYRIRDEGPALKCVALIVSALGRMLRLLTLTVLAWMTMSAGVASNAPVRAGLACLPPSCLSVIVNVAQQELHRCEMGQPQAAMAGPSMPPATP